MKKLPFSNLFTILNSWVHSCSNPLQLQNLQQVIIAIKTDRGAETGWPTFEEYLQQSIRLHAQYLGIGTKPVSNHQQAIEWVSELITDFKSTPYVC